MWSDWLVDVKSMMLNLFLSFPILVYHISAKKLVWDVNSKMWLQLQIWWSLKISVFGYFRVFINFLIANMYHNIRNRMAMKEKTVHSMKIFNFSCHIENKIVTFLQLIVKNFHLRCGLIGCMMSNQWCLTCFHLFLFWCVTSVLKNWYEM